MIIFNYQSAYLVDGYMYKPNTIVVKRFLGHEK